MTVAESIGYGLSNGAWMAANLTDYWAFRRAVSTPAETQCRILLETLKRDASTIYGQRHNFARIRSVREFQETVPVARYEDLQSDIDAIRDGRKGVLTSEPVLMLETTGGSSGAVKYIPYTHRLRREFTRAVNAWLFDLYQLRPGLLRTASYWSISPTARHREVTRGGIPVGFETDAEYFGGFERFLIERILAVPGELAKIDDMAVNRYVTLRFLLACRALGFVSIWHPTFWNLLMEAMTMHGPQLVKDLRDGTLTPPGELKRPVRDLLASRLRPLPERATAVAPFLDGSGSPPPRKLWPDLQLISCWASAASRQFIPALERSSPGVEIQPKGLLATEGVITIPLVGKRGGALAITSHFFEFLPSGDPAATPLLAHELTLGQRCTVLLTTGGGLVRYAIGDEVEVVGHVADTPLLEFRGRTGNASDLCGEKLTEAFVGQVLEEALLSTGLGGRFVMLVPELPACVPPVYHLLMEEPAATESDQMVHMEQIVEKALWANPHYAHCRRLGQLAPVRRVHIAARAQERYLDLCAAQGQRPGSIKGVYLRCEPGWTERLSSGRSCRA